MYNSLVRKRNQIENAFSAIDVMLKRRFDLIPNLVATVQLYAKHEADTFAAITEITTITIGPKIPSNLSISKATTPTTRKTAA